ncbi:MAG TPA: DUF4010 domain-containing protein [Acidobacteriaceae bacterium]|jgi:uncharacterized membrane protein (DUF4010 family)
MILYTGGSLPWPEQWPFLPVMERFGMAVAIGVFVGLEREHSGKAGTRTFGLIALLGCLAGIQGPRFIWIAMAFVLLLTWLINWRRLSAHDQLATTTSLSLAIVALCGVLCGVGHMYTPVLAAILCTALLAWKQPIHAFTAGLTQAEIRSAVLLAVLSGIILPALPSHPIDPWRLVQPRDNWWSVVLIAGIGFVNYILLRVIGPGGMEVTAFFGGLVNSRKVIVEFILRASANAKALLPVVYRGAMLATAAMALRNAIIVAVLAKSKAALLYSFAPLGLMFLLSAVLWARHPIRRDDGAVPALTLDSPFSLSAALKFGAVFLLLNVVGTLAQRHFGSGSFLFVSMAGGLLSSGSSIASASTLINHGEVPVLTGVIGVVLSSLTSVLINIPLLQRIPAEGGYRRKTIVALGGVALAGMVGIAIDLVWMHAHGYPL